MDYTFVTLYDEECEGETTKETTLCHAYSNEPSNELSVLSVFLTCKLKHVFSVFELFCLFFLILSY